jgi:hypothetical protein
VLPQEIEKWSLTSLQQRLVKTGARYYWLLLAESHLTRRLFASMLGRIRWTAASVGIAQVAAPRKTIPLPLWNGEVSEKAGSGAGSGFPGQRVFITRGRAVGNRWEPLVKKPVPRGLDWKQSGVYSQPPEVPNQFQLI